MASVWLSRKVAGLSGAFDPRNWPRESGTLYPILIRLAERKLLETRWETLEAGKPPRHMYKLTAGGLRYAREQVPSASKHPVGQPAFSGVKS